MTALAFVVTCKGRLHHLQQSLPRLVAQPDCECVVVDYDCPDHCGDWVAAHYPGVRVVRVADAPRFPIARARNLGAAACTSPWLCFVDADSLVAADFAATVVPLLRAGGYFRPLPMTWDKWGTVACRREDFLAIEGYDEVIEGWGGEDDDLYYRLGALGRQLGNFPGELLDAIAHEDVERTRYYDIGDKWTSQRINTLYLQLKYDIARQMGMAGLPLPMRQTLYGEVRRSLLQDLANGATAFRFEVNLPDNLAIPVAPGWAIQRRWVYDMGPLPGAAPATPWGRLVAEYFAAQPQPKLHIGCGRHLLAGWLNTDLRPSLAGVFPMDATQPLPFVDASFDYVFSEHVIEHMAYPQGCALLAECRRILKPGGVLRIATPDLAFFLSLYRDDTSAPQGEYLRWSKESFLPWAPGADPIFVINNAMRDWGHQFIYDDKLLRRCLAEAGFANVTRRALMESDIAALGGLENAARTPPGLLALETMVFEATGT